MRYSRLGLGAIRVRLLLLAAVLISPAALTAQVPAPARKTPAPARPDKEGTALLEAAIRKTDLKRLGWLNMTLWQELDLQGLTAEATGSYLAGRNHHLHLHLHVDLAGTPGELEVISDGTTLWQTSRLGQAERMIDRKVDLKRVLKVLNNPGTPGPVRTEFFHDQGFDGVTPLLETIRRRMTITRQKKIHWHGHEVNQLTGVWTQAAIKPFGPALPPLVARRCRIYLDAATGWPYRLEWWGALAPKGPEGLLLQMEFRNPTFYAQLPGRLADEFLVNPGNATVPDKTDDVLEKIKSQARQMKTPAKGE